MTTDILALDVVTADATTPATAGATCHRDLPGQLAGTEMANGALYHCPGEAHPISRAVHLSRLASFYPSCRDCPHGDDTGDLAERTRTRLRLTRQRVKRPSLFNAEGVRGVHRNEITRQDADRLASALAWIAWQDRPRHLVSPMPTSRSLPATPVPVSTGPVVVIGQDTRPAARDLLAGAIAGLVRSGCQVIETGITSDACLRFAVEHLQADAGLRVTGDGHPSTWIGLDGIAAGGRPLSRGAGLEAWESAARDGHPPSTRHAGRRRAFDAPAVYDANLRRHLLASRPLKVDLRAPEGPRLTTMTDLLAPLPWSIRSAAQGKLRPVDVTLAWQSDRCDLQVRDERDQPVSSTMIFLLLAADDLADHRDRTVVVAHERFTVLADIIRRLGGRPRATSGSTRSATWQSLVTHHAVLGIDPQGTIWTNSTSPTDDPLVIAARLLQLIDKSTRPLSERVRDLASMHPILSGDEDAF